MPLKPQCQITTKETTERIVSLDGRVITAYNNGDFVLLKEHKKV